jgi:signal recognition particle receptor subunit beta
MASINYAIREISVKIVYYGPGLSGKTTNLQVIHRKIPVDYRSDMVSLATETDRTLFFDFLPLDLGKIKGFSTKFQLYTVPGQVYYNATRKLVLRGVDGVVFVVDSAADKLQENLESFQNLQDNLAEYGYQQGSIPVIIQYNKRDLPNAMPMDKLDKLINKFGYPWSESIANQGKGVFESLKIMGKIVIDTLNKKYSRPSFAQPQESGAERYRQPAAPQPAPFQAPAPKAPAAERVFAPQPQRPQPKPAQSGQYKQDIFAEPAPQPVRPPSPAAFKPAPAAMPAQRDESQEAYYDYGSINLEPMAQQPSSSKLSPPPSVSTASVQQPTQGEKTELDLEIEKYQREIEDKQRHIQNLQSQTPQPQQPKFAPPQNSSYDVYEPPESSQIPQFPPRQAAEETPQQTEEGQPLYFTSVNTDRQRKKIKRPVNPKNKAQGSFFSKFFNKDKPE